jgi:hypothetical protein
MKLDHKLNPDDFSNSGYAPEALRRLLTGNWDGFEIPDLNHAFNALEAAHKWKARKTKLKVGDPVCIEIRKCLHALADVFATKWLDRGDDVFREKLDFYHRNARELRQRAMDELFYQAFLRIDGLRSSKNNRA